MSINIFYRKLILPFFVRKSWYDYIDDNNTEYSTSTELILTNSVTCSYDEMLIEKTKRVLTITQIYHLIITNKHSSINVVFDLIYLLPDVIRFKLHSLSPDDRAFSLKRFHIAAYLKFRSKIIYVYIEEINDIEDFNLISLLSPQMKYFQMKRINMNIESFLRTLLKGIGKSPLFAIRSLCFHVPSPNDQMIENLHQMIKYEQLLFQFIIKRLVDDIYIQWK